MLACSASQGHGRDRDARAVPVRRRGLESSSVLRPVRAARQSVASSWVAPAGAYFCSPTVHPWTFRKNLRAGRGAVRSVGGRARAHRATGRGRPQTSQRPSRSADLARQQQAVARFNPRSSPSDQRHAGRRRSEASRAACRGTPLRRRPCPRGRNGRCGVAVTSAFLMLACSVSQGHGRDRDARAVPVRRRGLPERTFARAAAL